MGAVSAASLMANAGNGTSASWLSAVDGFWNQSMNWDTMLVPGSNDHVILGLFDSYNVIVSGFESADSLSIENANAQLTINNAQSLSLFGNIENEGMVLVNSVAGNSSTSLFFEETASVTGSGKVVLNGFGPRARIASETGMFLTQGALHTIEGNGQIESELVNDGVVSANVIANKLSLLDNPKTNNSVMRAINGGVLDISGITLTQGPFGVISADGLDSEVQLTGCTVVGGSFAGSNGGDISVTNASTLDGVETTCSIRVENSHTLNIRNSLINNAEITVNPVSGGLATSMMFLDSSSLEGMGSVVLNGFGVRASIDTAPGEVLFHHGGHTIEGQGQIQAELINNGLVSANSVATSLVLMENDKVNNGVMEAVGGAVLGVSGITVRQQLDASEGAEAYLGLIIADGLDSMIQLSGCTIVDGQLMTVNQGSAVVTCATTLDDVGFSGDINVLSSHRLIIKEGTTASGLITINPVNGEAITSLEWGDNMILEGDATILLAGFGARSQLSAGLDVKQGGIGDGIRLVGSGQIAINFINNGTIAPGLSLGTMKAVQPIEFTKTAKYEVEVNQIESDLLDSVSIIELGGLLEIELIDGFMPNGYWARTIMEASAINGEFDSMSFPPTPAGLVDHIYNTGTEYLVGQTCPSDLNLDGASNFFDVSVFLEAFSDRDPSADINEDGRFNFFDVSLFIQELDSGCEF